MSYLALYFDINFPETYQIIKEQDYIRRIAERVPYSREDTKEKVAYTVKKTGRKDAGSAMKAAGIERVTIQNAFLKALLR
mgnify:CR=1 FL=1